MRDALAAARRIAALSLGVTLSLAFLTAAWTQDYPAKPIRLLITSPAGSLVDVLGRAFAQDLGDRLGQSVIVDNRPGAMTQIASDTLTRANADGYTLMLGAVELTMLPYLRKNYRYDPLKDFTPVSLIATSWTVFAVNPKVPVRTLAELVAYSKANPVRYGSGGVGGALHIAVEMLNLKTGAQLIHVPYRGGAQAATDAIAGQIEMVSMGLASTRVAEGGQLRILAQTGPIRHPMLPDVPTTAELGLPEVRMDTWFGLFGPPDLPDDIVAKLAAASGAVAKEATFRERLNKIGCDTAFLAAATFREFIAQDSRKWQQLIPLMGIAAID
jgi:tripartite-type tricarboxylate transporter receptor subunit TctC